MNSLTLVWSLCLSTGLVVSLVGMTGLLDRALHRTSPRRRLVRTSATEEINKDYYSDDIFGYYEAQSRHRDERHQRSLALLNSLKNEHPQDTVAQTDGSAQTKKSETDLPEVVESGGASTNAVSLGDMSTPLPAFVNVLQHTGLCSQLLNMFVKAIYFQETQNRTLIADESTYAYRMNATTGFLKGYFTPKFPVIDSKEQYQEVQPYFADGFEYAPTRWKWRVGENHTKEPIMAIMTGDFRGPARSHRAPDSIDLFEKLVETMCPHMQFNDHARQRIYDYQHTHGGEDVPDDESTTNSSKKKPLLPSVAFHVRRGDKTKGDNPADPKNGETGESELFTGEDYVQKLLEVTPPNTTVFQDCFVASDSYQPVQEIRDALERHEVSCRVVWTLTQPSEDGSWAHHRVKASPDEFTLEFLSELQVMIRATYFVGTFGSNVGAMVAVLRGCHDERGALGSHYFDSYGVDSDKWWFR